MGETYKVEIIDAHPRRRGAHALPARRAGEQRVGRLLRGPARAAAPASSRAVKLTSVAGAYWRGDERNPMLQRIYGTAFPSQEGARRAPASCSRRRRSATTASSAKSSSSSCSTSTRRRCRSSCRAARSSTTARRLRARALRRVRLRRGHHAADLRQAPVRDQRPPRRTTARTCTCRSRPTSSSRRDAGATPTKAAATASELGSRRSKPMNCPSHCLIFGAAAPQLPRAPWRVADFGRLHRYERGGVVHGLDPRAQLLPGRRAHLLHAASRSQAEIQSFIELLFEVYSAFELHRRRHQARDAPREAHRHRRAVGQRRERARRRRSSAEGSPFEMPPGEGAFYGPKLEFHVEDALKRSWQLGTIRSTTRCPSASSSSTSATTAAHRPVMLHRAILGSLERFFGIYIEHMAGGIPGLARARAGVAGHGQREAGRVRRRSVRRDSARAGLRVDARLRRRQAGRQDPQRATDALPLHRGRRRQRGEARTLVGPLARQDGRARRRSPLADVRRDACSTEADARRVLQDRLKLRRLTSRIDREGRSRRRHEHTR